MAKSDRKWNYDTFKPESNLTPHQVKKVYHYETLLDASFKNAVKDVVFGTLSAIATVAIAVHNIDQATQFNSYIYTVLTGGSAFYFWHSARNNFNLFEEIRNRMVIDNPELLEQTYINNVVGNIEMAQVFLRTKLTPTEEEVLDKHSCSSVYGG